MSPSSVFFFFFGLAGEDWTVKFQSVTGLPLNVSDSFSRLTKLVCVLEDEAISGHGYFKRFKANARAYLKLEPKSV